MDKGCAWIPNKTTFLSPSWGRLPGPTCRVATAVAPMMFQSCNLGIIVATGTRPGHLGHLTHGVSNQGCCCQISPAAIFMTRALGPIPSMIGQH